MTTVFDVIDLLTGYQQAAAVTAAARLGVFDALDGRARTAPEVAEELGTDQLATRALLDALLAMDLLIAEADLYRATDLGARLGHEGDLRLIAEKEAFFARHWLDLADSVRTGRPRLAPWAERVASDPRQARFFLRALVVLARETGPDLTGIAGLGPGSRVVDLGAGLGAYSTQLASAGVRVTLVDLPRVVEWAEEELSALDASVRERITTVPTDLLSASAVADIGTDHDGVLLSHLMHDLDDADALAALRRAAELVRPGGAIVVFELPGDPPGAFGPLFDLMMRVETPGRARRLDELADLMRRAGLDDVRVSAAHRMPHGVLTARG